MGTLAAGMEAVLGEIPARLRRGVRRHGVLGALRMAPYLRERPIWYRLDLEAGRQVRPLPETMRLRRGGAADLERLQPELLRVRLHEARHWLTQPGVELWIVEEDGAPVFACWLFTERTPVATARFAWLDLPEGVVCLEDSMASPAIRGRGVAPATWSMLGEDLRARGATALITKVDAGNEASRRAVQKAGFAELLPMDVRRLGPIWRARATQPVSEPLAETLLERLAR